MRLSQIMDLKSDTLGHKNSTSPTAVYQKEEENHTKQVCVTKPFYITMVTNQVNPCYYLFLLVGAGVKTFHSFILVLILLYGLFIFSRRCCMTSTDNIVFICKSSNRSKIDIKPKVAIQNLFLHCVGTGCLLTKKATCELDYVFHKRNILHILFQQFMNMVKKIFL